MALGLATYQIQSIWFKIVWRVLGRSTTTSLVVTATRQSDYSGTKLGKGEHGQQTEANSKAFNTDLETEDYDDTTNWSAKGQNKDHGRKENLQGEM